MMKFIWMKDPVKGVFSPEFRFEFIWPCDIDADLRVIARQSSPDFSFTLTEGDGRTRMFAQQEMRPAEQVAAHLNRKSRSVIRLIMFPVKTIDRQKMVPQGGDKEVFE